MTRKVKTRLLAPYMTLEEAWRLSDGVAKCPSNRLFCRFEPSLEDESVVVEFCTNCGKRVYYNKVDGRIDNLKYLRDHVVDFLQPDGPTSQLYFEVYGYDAINSLKKEAKKRGKKLSPDEWREHAFDTYKTIRSLVNSGKKIEEI